MGYTAVIQLVGNFSKAMLSFNFDSWGVKQKSPCWEVLYIEAEGERKRIWRIEAEERRKLAEESRKIAQEIQQQKDKEALRMKKMFLDATRLHQTNIIREYIKTVEAKAIENEPLTDELKDWIQWANNKADWYDPLINGDDPLLDDVYKTNIFKEFLKEWQ